MVFLCASFQLLQFEEVHTYRISTSTWDQQGGLPACMIQGLGLNIKNTFLVADDNFWRAATAAMETRFCTLADALFLIRCDPTNYQSISPFVESSLVSFFDCVYEAYDRCSANVSLFSFSSALQCTISFADKVTNTFCFPPFSPVVICVINCSCRGMLFRLELLWLLKAGTVQKCLHWRYWIWTGRKYVIGLWNCTIGVVKVNDGTKFGYALPIVKIIH